MPPTSGSASPSDSKVLTVRSDVTGNSSRGGFTLIELIMVVVIMGIVVAVAATRLDFLVPKYRLRGGAREVAAAFKLAKARAAATGREVYLEMDLSEGRYWLLVAFPREPEAAEAATGVEPRGLQYEPIFEQTLPEGVEFWDVVFGPKERVETGRARVRLSPFGASTHTIVNLRNKEDRRAAVRFNGFTGYVTFYEERKDAEELLEDAGP